MKLMTMLAVAATALGLSAADSGFKAGSSFEATEVGGCMTGEYTAGQELANGNDWTIPAENAKATVVAGVSRATDRPLQYQGSSATQAQFLEVATTLGNPIALNVPTEAWSINEGLYFDGLVNMTVFDKGDEPVAQDAKLAVYLQLKGDDEADGTNFIVRAGGANGATNYDVASADVTPGWHRLTVKAISNIYKTGAAQACPGFVVFVDGTAVNYVNTQEKTLDKGIVAADLTIAATQWNENGKLFPSLQSGTQDSTMIYSVAFDGKGQVDDLAVTATAPSFAEDEDGYYVSFDDKTIASITIGTETFTTSPAMIIGLPTADVTVTYVGKDDYMGGTKTLTQASIKSGETIDLNVTPDLAAAKIGDLKFEHLPDAVAYANATNENCTITLIQNAEDGFQIANETAVITLDLNGKTIEADSEDMSFGGTAAITGNGVIKPAFAGDDAALTIENGTFDGLFTEFDGTLIINGGKFLNPPSAPTGKKWVKGEDNYYTIADKVAVTSVTLGTKALALDTGATSTQITYEYDPQNADVDSVVWSSDATDVATVADGVVTAVAAGTANITITINGTVTDACVVTVTEPTVAVTSVEINEGDAITIKVGETRSLTATVKPDDATDKTVTWESAAIATATVSNDGVVEGVAVGTVVITAKAGEKTDTITVTVEAAAPVIDPAGGVTEAKGVEADNGPAAENAVKAAVKAPEVEGLTDEAYADYFTYSATAAGDGKWDVKVELDAEVVEPDETAAELAGKFDEITAGAGQVTIENAKPGLWYSVIEGAELDNRAEGDRAQATKAGVTLKTTKYPTSGFYQIKVSTTETDTND